MAANATGNEDNKTWGIITLLTYLFFGTPLPFIIVRKNVREAKGIEVNQMQIYYSNLLLTFVSKTKGFFI